MANMTPVTILENYAIEADGLVIKNVSGSDEGVYKCWVTVYTLGDTKERYIKLQVRKPRQDTRAPLFPVFILNNSIHFCFSQVQEKPKILHLVKEVEGVEGESVHIKCTGEGKPRPEFEWLHRGQPLYGTPRHIVDK